MEEGNIERMLDTMRKSREEKEKVEEEVKDLKCKVVDLENTIEGLET